MYQTIKKFLNDGGKCLLIENGKPVGVVLTVEEYELLQNKSQISNPKSETEIEKEKSLFSEANNKPAEPIASNPIGEAMAKEMDFPEASAEISDIETTDDITLEDLGVDPDIQFPKDF